MQLYNQKDKIQEHYDLISPYYHKLWGIHLHHGFWQSGKETNAEAQESLTKELVSRAGLTSGMRILDVGCGMRGSSIYLTKNLNAKVTGITISPQQVDMAKKFAEEAEMEVDFRVMDADNLDFNEKFDCIWSVEAISHFNNWQKFFRDISNLLNSRGTIAVIDWFKKNGLTREEEEKYIKPIEKGMLVELKTMNDYEKVITETGNEVVYSKNISKEVAKTWDLCLDIIKDKTLWTLALTHSLDFVNFLKSFQSMRTGYASGALEYGLIVAKRKKL